MYSRTDYEVKIRSVLEEQGVNLNYEQIVDERKSEFPKPRDVDKKLKEDCSVSLVIRIGKIYIKLGVLK